MSSLSAFWRKQQKRLYRRGIDPRHQLRRHLAYYVVKHGFEIGDYSAGSPTISMWGEGRRLKIGKYCSIAEGAQFVLGGNHYADHVTTFPFGRLTGNYVAADHYSRGDIVVGSDVWIGKDAMILSGVTIGDGAAVAASSVVLEDVGPYVVVLGNPARPYSKRFCDAIVRQLLTARWWDLDHEQVIALRPLLQSENAQAVIEACCRIRGIPVPDDVSGGVLAPAPAPITPPSVVAMPSTQHTEAAISSWCVNYAATLLEIPAQHIDTRVTFAHLGMDSVARASFMAALEESLNVTITPDDIAEHATIAALAHHLARGNRRAHERA